MDTWHSGILLSMNDYDEIGRLKTATIGGFVNHNFAYNVRSWIVGDTIPNPNFNYAPSSGGFTPPVIPPLFAEKLQYSLVEILFQIITKMDICLTVAIITADIPINMIT